jgi:hypothetical protein
MGAFYRVLPGVVKLFLRAILAGLGVQVTSLIYTTHAMADLMRQVVSNG